MKILVVVLISMVLLCGLAFGQKTGGAFDIVDEIANMEKPAASNNDIIAGFSMGALIGGLLFGGIGFVALVYGKKTARFRTMIIGVFLVMLPYFAQSPAILYPVGIVLTLGLYLTRQ